jgi:glutaminase
MTAPSAETHPIQMLLDRVHADCLADQSGEVASYIPELGRANPDHFGVCIATVEGQVFEVGDTRVPFTIQSISKPFVFAMALEEHGRDKVMQHVGVEPSGEAFNSIDLQRSTNLPFNPMVNAGAIATASLIGGPSEQRLQRVLDRFSRAAGRPLSIDRAVFESERTTGHRNRAIAHLLNNFGALAAPVDETLDLYFAQCSIQVDARDLALMAATLANLGTHPITGEEVFSLDCVRDALSVMFTCGLYDYSGEWAFRVGVPAKSGVAGGVLSSVNRQLGMGLYSPRLDLRGNSARGIRACVDIAADLGLHAFDFMNYGSTFLKTLIPVTAKGLPPDAA